MTISTAGIYDLSATEYHAAPTPSPSLSSTIARELIAHSARHAWWATPALNPEYEREEDERFDIGTAAHALLLEGREVFSLIDAPDWRSKLAREGRDDARSRGKVPLLVHQWAAIQKMIAAANEQLDRYEDKPRPFSDGRPEESLIWEEDGVWLRSRLDWLHADHRTIDDYKTVAGTANPEAWTRGPLFSMGYDIQCAFYLRGLKAVMGTEGTFRFVVQEVYPPFALSVISLAPDALDLANRKVTYAINLWRECVTSGRWPGYPSVTCFAEAPPWESARWMAQEMGAPMPYTDGQPMAQSVEEL